MEFVLFIFPRSEEIKTRYNLASLSEDLNHNAFWMDLTHVDLFMFDHFQAKAIECILEVDSVIAFKSQG